MKNIIKKNKQHQRNNEPFRFKVGPFRFNFTSFCFRNAHKVLPHRHAKCLQPPHDQADPPLSTPSQDGAGACSVSFRAPAGMACPLPSPGQEGLDASPGMISGFLVKGPVCAREGHAWCFRNFFPALSYPLRRLSAKEKKAPAQPMVLNLETHRHCPAASSLAKFAACALPLLSGRKGLQGVMEMHSEQAV